MHTHPLVLRKRKKPIMTHQTIERFWGKVSEPVYEIPLIELIIRKGISKTSRNRVKIVHGNYTYKPSQSYMNYISKMIPLTKRLK